MSDELDDMRDALKAARPSDAARAKGMDAAMAAFGAEFGAATTRGEIHNDERGHSLRRQGIQTRDLETDLAQDASLDTPPEPVLREGGGRSMTDPLARDAQSEKTQKNTPPAQGSDSGRRLTSRKARNGRAGTGRRVMSKLSKLALAVGGTGVAAVLAMFIVVKQDGALMPEFQTASEELAVSLAPTPLQVIPPQFKSAKNTEVVAGDDSLGVVPATRRNETDTVVTRADANGNAVDAPQARDDMGIRRVAAAKAKKIEREHVAVRRVPSTNAIGEASERLEAYDKRTGATIDAARIAPAVAQDGVTSSPVATPDEKAIWRPQSYTRPPAGQRRQVAGSNTVATLTNSAPVKPMPQMRERLYAPLAEAEAGQGSVVDKDQQRVYQVRRVAVPGKTATIQRRILQEDGSIQTISQTARVEEPAESLQIVSPMAGVAPQGGIAAPKGYRLAVKPATYKTVPVTVPVMENWKGEVLETRTAQRRVVVTPATTHFVPLDPNSGLENLPLSAGTIVKPDPVIATPPTRDRFSDFEPNPVIAVAGAPVSTFSIDVDTASYTFLRSSLNGGHLPQANAIRLEEMINYFPYDYAAPDSADEPFRANVTVTPTPWNADTKLMHIGIKGYTPPRDARPNSNIVLLIDTSGSMNQPNKLPLLINSFKLLLNTLDAEDTVSIVTYAGSAGTVLEPTPASDKRAILAAFDRLRAGGSTAGAAGLKLAYDKAQESFDPDGVNRVILATDGDFNVGFSSPEEMKTFVEAKRETGVFLSVLGFGRGNYNDAPMQALAQNGNGVAAYIDTLSEARKVLADESGGSLIPIAKDVKIQVEFNPGTISEYRLIGYETRALKREDFNNDAVDAGDINAGHTVTAIYEITPKGSPAQVIDDLRYVSDEATETDGSDEYAFVKIRHKLPDSDTSTLQTRPVTPADERTLDGASADMRFATAVAAIGQKLRGQSQVRGYSYDYAIALATGARGEDAFGYRAEFINLARLAKSLDEER